MSIRSILLASLCVVTACAAELSPTGGNTGGGGSTGGGSTGSGGGDSGSGGGGNTGGSNTGGTGMTATQFLAQMDMKYCDEAFTCQASFPAQQGATFADEFGASASECYANGTAYDMPDVVETEITAGKIHFDASAAASCVAGITFPACATFWTSGPTYPTACDTALVGTVADGGACVVDYDCSTAGSVCDQTAHTCGAAPAGA